MAIDVAELAVVHDDQCEERQGHAEKIEEKRRCILECVFDEDEGRAPYDDDRQQKKVGDGAGAESFGQLLLRSCAGGCGVDDFAVDYGAKDLGVQEFLRGGLGDVAIEDNKVS